MNRRKFLIGVAASAVAPALPPVPVRAITATEVQLKAAEAMARIESVIYPFQKAMLRHLVLYGHVEVDCFVWPPKLIEHSNFWRHSVELNTILAGASFRSAVAKDFIKTELSRDTKIVLEREPNNQYDSNAIKVVCKDEFEEDVFIGYIPKVDNAVLAMALDAGKPYTIVHTGFQGTLQPTFRVEFEPLSIEERNEAQDEAAAIKAEREAFANDDEIPF